MAKEQPKPKEKPQQEKKYIAVVRTALSGPNDGITKAIPDQYRNASVGELLRYLTDKKNIDSDEVMTADSIRKEMNGQYTVEINGKPAKAEQNVSELFQEKEYQGRAYNSLEIDIASVQQGGLVKLLG
jgi:hypothetical protein